MIIYTETIMGYTCIFEEDERGGFWGRVEELPGCLTQGENMKDVERNMREAILLYIEE